MKLTRAKAARCFLLWLLVAGGCGSGEGEFHQDTWLLVSGGDRDDEAVSVARSGDRGLVLAGNTDSYGAGAGDIWLVSLGLNGEVQWQRAIGGPGKDVASSIVRTGGGFILSGITESFGEGMDDAWILGLDSGGAVQWEKTLGGSRHDFAYIAAESSDGGFFVCGRSGSTGSVMDSALLVKLDGSGEPVWQKSIGSDRFEEALGAEEASGGELMVFGNAGDSGDLDMWALRLDRDGNILWQKTVGGAENDRVVSSAAWGGDSLVLVGVTKSFGAGADDIWVVKLDGGGGVLWQKTFGGNDDEWVGSAAGTADGGIVIAGQTWSFPSIEYAAVGYVMKLDIEGNLLWQKSIRGGGLYEACSVMEGDDRLVTVAGKVLLSGSDNLDVFVAKLDDRGGVFGGCSLLVDISFQSRDSEAEARDWGAAVSDANLILQDSEAAVEDSGADASYLCPH